MHFNVKCVNMFLIVHTFYFKNKQTNKLHDYFLSAIHESFGNDVHSPHLYPNISE